ncbi:NAD-binding protein [Halomarina ordinaria]|uniref:NAD-binding protein n=1 Tax=Halomarina ordinaria TaxID=3033939 RepID=A0ABD5UBG8_9EURY|nr:NAD-binding protein [Halomarina sp. PSRA2]
MSPGKPYDPLEQQLRHLRSVESLGDLSGRQRKVVTFGAALATLLVCYALVYQYGMRTLEGTDRTFFQALNTVVATMTTTGYGSDAPWGSPWMNALVVSYQLSGIVIGLVTLRILIIPLFERAPVVLDDRLTSKDGHVVVCEYGRGKDVLLDELEESGIEYVLVNSDKQEAIDLSNRDYQAIDGDPTRTETLERASVGKAAFVVSDAGDRNASVLLTARRLNDEARLLCLTETQRRREALERIGADRVVCPSALIGRRLAEKATTTFDLAPSVDGFDDDTVVRELVVRRGGALDGTRVGETAVAAAPELTLVAAWVDGELRLPPRPTDRLTPDAVLVVVGPASSLESADEGVAGVRSPRRHTSVVVAGVGQAGSTAVERFPDEVDVVTVDVEDGPDADVVGDASEAATLREAGLEDATALVVALDDDDDALLTTAIGRSLTDDIEILVRVSDAENVPKAFDAGADYALSEQRTTARTLATEVHRESVVHPVGQVRFIRVDGENFADESLADADDRSGSGRVLVGVERNGALHTDETTTIRLDDTVVVAGTDEMLHDFEHDAVGE